MTKTGAGLAAWSENIITANTHVYWYGTYCNPCTESRLAGKTKQYPSHYKASRQATYKKHILQGKTCTDCIGLIKGYYWEDNGEIKYKRNSLPDTSASGMYRAAKIKDKITSIPEIPGLLVWTKDKGHVGIYVGGGYIVEARGFSYGVQRNKLSARSFAYWGMCPYIKYTTEEIAKAEAAINETKTPAQESANNGGNTVMIELSVLKNGSKGAQVKTLQRLLKALGYDCGTIDGIFGANTLTAVKSFQKTNDLTVDGIIGKNTWDALLK
jgi:cell wall-associated NlpC family hydrolase